MTNHAWLLLGAYLAMANVSPDSSLNTVVGCVSNTNWQGYVGEATMTPIEYRLLTYLIANPCSVLTHRQLLRNVWGPSHAEDSHYVRIYMGHLRKKLERDPSQPTHFVTEAGIGYRFIV